MAEALVGVGVAVWDYPQLHIPGGLQRAVGVCSGPLVGPRHIKRGPYQIWIKEVLLLVQVVAVLSMDL